MNGPHLIARLRDHQTAILANTDRARAMLAWTAMPSDSDMERLRFELVRLLSAYQYFKHREIFDVLIADGSSDEARIARRLKAECISLGEEVRQFVEKRHHSRLHQPPDDYREEVLAFIRHIREHMDYERRAAAALLLHAPGERAVIPPPSASLLPPDRPTRAG